VDGDVLRVRMIQQFSDLRQALPDWIFLEWAKTRNFCRFQKSAAENKSVAD